MGELPLSVPQVAYLIWGTSLLCAAFCNNRIPGTSPIAENAVYQGVNRLAVHTVINSYVFSIRVGMSMGVNKPYI